MTPAWVIDGAAGRIIIAPDDRNKHIKLYCSSMSTFITLYLDKEHVAQLQEALTLTIDYISSGK